MVSLTHTLGCAANCGVAVSSSLLVSLDLLADFSLDLVRAAGNKILSSLSQATEAFFKTCYFLHQCLRKISQIINTFLNKLVFKAEKKESTVDFFSLLHLVAC